MSAPFFLHTVYSYLAAVGAILKKELLAHKKILKWKLTSLFREISKCHQKWVHVYRISGQMTTSLTANFRFTFVGWLIYTSILYEKKKKKRYWASSYDNEFYITAKIMSDFWGKFGVMCLQQFRMSHGVQSAVVKCHHLTESVLISWCPSIIKISTASSCFSIFNTCQLFTKKLKVCSSVYGLFYQVGKTIWLSLIFNTAGISYK